MSEQPDQPDQPPSGYEIRSSHRFDRDNLPDEFTADFLDHVVVRDLLWLESDADLTPRQREAFSAWSSDRYGAIAKAFRQQQNTFSKLLGTRKPWWSSVGLSARDALGENIRKSVDGLRESVTEHTLEVHDAMHLTDSATVELNGQVVVPIDKHADQMRAFGRLHDTSDRMAELLALPVERTEQQYRAAQRQKTTNWLLACIAGASMIGTFATVQGTTRMWLALIATFVIIGVLYVVMNIDD
ncbi:hypothetical protein [Kribbella sp. NBC_00889]|uniref:hypothetical protein n=1 Tax=Kribbella sp. NBC_00889 TaxID=2975974 RepID=UPI003865D14D|nr:hypothetical protein OG817_24505 [Kribbella sp. NBC_00889]